MLVFVHGFLVNGDLWRKVVPTLAATYRCVTPDWPAGSHEVPLRRPADFSLPGMAQIVADFLAALDLRDVTLIGNDSGGAVVQRTAVDHPERLARIVLTPCDAFDVFPPSPFGLVVASAYVPGMPWLSLQAMRVRALRRLPFAYGWFAKHPIDEAAMRSYIEPGLRSPGVRRDMRDLLFNLDRAWTRNTAERLREFTGPALVVRAGDDRLFPAEDGRRLARALSDASLVTIPDCYTAIPEDRPDELAATIADFLAKTASPRPAAGRLM
ncbi:alpha/beta fold hydrolase [Actinomadura rudentiformis]|uniref:alpha/beta fold hydrolase n=1 Tax=Actinomadura rudentiformis TaxID=359158 RepID=UPI0021F47349|nr:alpha/beta hydrolase [Actinomadura rudentiformis]